MMSDVGGGALNAKAHRHVNSLLAASCQEHDISIPV